MDPRAQRQIARINELSALARTSWIGLLAYLAFVFVTLLGVEDADFFVPSRQTQLPLVNVSIPTASFFIFAPILAAALYVYLHLFLIKLWDAIGAAPVTVDDRALVDAIHPWLANSFATSMIGGAAHVRRPLDWLSNFVTALLVWIAGPFVVAAVWWRSMSAHDPLLTGLVGVALALSLLAGDASWSRARARLSLSTPAAGEDRRTVLLAICLFSALAFATFARTSWNIVVDSDTPLLGRILERGAVGSLAPTDFEAASLVPLPEQWRDPEIARRGFRETWCRREALPMPVCDHLADLDRLQTSGVGEARAMWCAQNGLAKTDDCAARFLTLDDRFWSEWSQERASARAALGRLHMAGRDLRWLRGRGVSLVGADLNDVRLERSDLRSARLEGVSMVDADLRGAAMMDARLEFAQLRSAQLQGANLDGARLDGAVLTAANLQGVQLKGARLDRAVLSNADLRAAYMSRATLNHAILDSAELEGSRLDGSSLDHSSLYVADLKGTNFTFASLRSADLRGADLSSGVLVRANLSRADLSEADLEETVLIDADLTRANLNGAKLIEANLRAAQLGEATLIDTDLSGSDLAGADLSGAVLWGTRASGVVWKDARLRAVAPWADLRGATGLSQAQLDGVIGNRATLLPDGLAPDTRRPFTIWDCWLTAPADFDHALAALIGAKYDNETEARADLVCPSGEAPTPRGVPCGIDLSAEECLDPARNPDHPANSGG